jgi:prepilin-type N-terminal cleavage/methylation domain-containing protein
VAQFARIIEFGRRAALGPFGQVLYMKLIGRIAKPSRLNEARVPDFRRKGMGRALSGFTLAEVLISLAIAAIMFSGLINAYIQSSYRAEWSGYSLAAQALAIQQLEQARAANWDISTYPSRNEITNVPAITASVLDLPVNGTNVIWATNYTTITSVPITNTVGASIYMVRVDTAWPFLWSGKRSYFTNTVADFFAPD